MPDIDVTPSKFIFKAIAADITEEDAISDIIDNSLDSWRWTRKQETLEIKLSLEKDQVSFSDNAGGLDKDTIKLMLMPGGSKWRGGDGIKGIWGVGAKRALFYLGKSITIRTRVKGEDGIVLSVDEKWFEDDESKRKWKLKYDVDNTIPEETTTIKIEDLNINVNLFVVSQIRRRVIEKYKDEIADEKLKLSLNEELISEALEVPWAKSEYAPPSRYITDLPVPDSDRKLRVKITAGVMTRPGEDFAFGIDFVGNKRLILGHNLDERMGFEKTRLGRAHPTINRFRAIVRVDGHSGDIPWNSAKNDINPNHPMHTPIVDLVYQVSRQYTTFLRANYEMTSTLFRHKATESDIEEIVLEQLKDFEKVVKDYEEPKRDVKISFSVPREDFEELIEYFDFRRKPKKHIGRYIFNLVLRKVVRDEPE